MKNLWRESEARAFLARYRAFGEEVALRTYSARLIGRDRTLVLHGGGNTSVKSRATDLTGETVAVLHIKGSGWDLASIEPAGHPAVLLDPLKKLRALKALSDEDMVNFLRTHLLDAAAPTPSVETLLHAFLPAKFIDHTHANAVLALVNRPDGQRRALDWGQGRLAVVPYIMPGFALAKAAAQVFEQNPRVEGLVLLKHGFFTFGQTARESYDRMIRWVARAEALLAKPKPVSFTSLKAPNRTGNADVARVANAIRGVCGDVRPFIVRHRVTPALLNFVGSKEARSLSQRGPATPDHVIRTKPVPLLLPLLPLENDDRLQDIVRKAISRFRQRYEAVFRRQTRAKKIERRALDSAPRVVLAPGVGVFALGETPAACDVALDIYEATVGIIEHASRDGVYQALSEGELFDMEYWSLEQAKLGVRAEKPLTGQVVWLSGAASGIGLATARVFAQAGAAVFLTDLNEGALQKAAASLPENMVDWTVCDVTQDTHVQRAFDRCSAVFGGVDIVVSNAGAAPQGDMAVVSDKDFRKSFEINFFSHQRVAQAACRVFRRQGMGGVLLFNASKSAFNPGAGFGPYAIPKASLVALTRQYAIEGGPLGIRANAVNADRVRTALFDPALIKQRAKVRGVSVDRYFTDNLLQAEVRTDDVAQAFLHLALARKTTGAVWPVDGGNPAAFPR